MALRTTSTVIGLVVIRPGPCPIMFISPLYIPALPSEQHYSFPRRVFAPGLVSLVVPAPPKRGGAERRETRGACEAPPACLRGTPGACEAPASLAIGTLASRRSTLAIFGVGSAFPA